VVVSSRNGLTPPDRHAGIPDTETTHTLPRISVVIPWIGREKYISSTLTALREQDYGNLEIIVSDNSMSADAGALLRNIAGDNVRLIERSQVRLSSSEHFTACIADATGEYVMILSDDDLIEPGYISGMYEAIRLHPASSAVLGEQIVIGENDTTIPSDSGVSRMRHIPGTRFILQRLINPRSDLLWTYVSVFGRRLDFLAHPYRDYPDGSNSDNFMMLCLALAGDVTISSKKMYYRIYESSAGLKTPFFKLMQSCVGFERDALTLIGRHDGGTTPSFKVLFRILIRLRNASMMSRRLVTLYRRRMNWRDFICAGWQLVRYLAGSEMKSG